MKKQFVEARHWHVYFVYFIISYILASGDFGTTRGDYLMRIVLNKVPEEKGLVKIFKRTFRFASMPR